MLWSADLPTSLQQGGMRVWVRSQPRRANAFALGACATAHLPACTAA